MNSCHLWGNLTVRSSFNKGKIKTMMRKNWLIPKPHNKLHLMCPVKQPYHKTQRLKIMSNEATPGSRCVFLSTVSPPMVHLLKKALWSAEVTTLKAAIPLHIARDCILLSARKGEMGRKIWHGWGVVATIEWKCQEKVLHLQKSLNFQMRRDVKWWSGLGYRHCTNIEAEYLVNN